MRHAIGAGPQFVPPIGPSAPATCTCAGIAPLSSGRHSGHGAGACGRWASGWPGRLAVYRSRALTDVDEINDSRKVTIMRKLIESTAREATRQNEERPAGVPPYREAAPHAGH